MTTTLYTLGIDRLSPADRLRLVGEIWDSLPPADRRPPAAHRQALDRQLTEVDAPAVVHADPDILSGTPVFVGTRVPLKTLFDYLDAGQPLDEFLDDFPSVTRGQAVAALGVAQRMLTAHAYSAR